MMMSDDPPSQLGPLVWTREIYAFDQKLFILLPPGFLSLF